MRKRCGVQAMRKNPNPNRDGVHPSIDVIACLVRTDPFGEENCTRDRGFEDVFDHCSPFLVPFPRLSFKSVVGKCFTDLQRSLFNFGLLST